MTVLDFDELALQSLMDNGDDTVHPDDKENKHLLRLRPVEIVLVQHKGVWEDVPQQTAQGCLST